MGFGKYRLLERIAMGGMAEVFLAVRGGLEGFEKVVALKRMRPHLSREDPFVRMFLHEAKLAAQLQHPNIVQIYDLGKVDANYFIAMEYIPGRDMSRVIPKAEELGIRFPIEYAMAIVSSVLDGLAFAHTKTDDLGDPLHIVHRDVTPENIMVGWNGNVKILDFGIAKAVTQSDETRAGEIKGKLSYMSPEQCLGKSLDGRSDIFTLGVVLYEWITGYKLFTGENEMAVLRSIIDGRIYPPSYFREDLPEGVEEILMRALEKDRDRRYQTARDFQFEIQAWLRQHVEFNPTPSHLATFMRQLFGTEMDAERVALHEAKLRKRPSLALLGTTPPMPPAEGSDDPAVGEALGRAKTPAAGHDAADAAALIVVDDDDFFGGEAEDIGRSVVVDLSPGEFARLRAAAVRNGMVLEELAADVLRTTLRYL